MAMRPRGGGEAGSRRTTRAGVVRPVYEDFKPVSEWQQDDESHILNIYLPGFMKEQIRVSTEGRNIIRVRGERLVAGNKWSRFLEDFQVPENGEMNSVRAKFHGGILSITVPKEKVSKPQEALTPETRKEAVSQPTKDVKGGTEQQTKRADDGNKKGQDTAVGPETRKEAVSQPTKEVKGDTEQQTKRADDGNKKGQDTAVGASQPTEAHTLFEPYYDLDDDQNGRSITPLGSIRNKVSRDNEKKDGIQKAPVDHVKAQDVDGDQRGRSFTPTLRAGNAMPRNAENAKEKHVASEKPEDVTKGTVYKEGKERTRGSQLPETETIRKNKLEKSGATGIPADSKDLYGASKKQNYNKAMEGMNKERQLLVNMGASLLVIVALTAYVTYSFTSAKHKN